MSNNVLKRMAAYQIKIGSDKRYRNLLPFLMVYYFVTQEVVSYAKAGQFKNGKAVEILDRYFAQLYFKPLDNYLNDGKLTQPWKNYFEYCSKLKSQPFVCLLLGIHAHINGDLAQALAKTNYQEREDFLLINEILLKVWPKTMWYLVLNYRDQLAALGLVNRSFFESQFNQTIAKWRQEAWINAQKINNQKKVEVIKNRSEKMAKEIIEIFKGIKNPLLVKRKLTKLHSLSVTI